MKGSGPKRASNEHLRSETGVRDLKRYSNTFEKACKRRPLIDVFEMRKRVREKGRHSMRSEMWF